MCDASDFVVGDVLGQRVDKKLNLIHYASKTHDRAQKNYATTEKEFLVVVFACDKLGSILLILKLLFILTILPLSILWRRRMPNQGLSDGYSFFKSLICRLSIEKE